MYTKKFTLKSDIMGGSGVRMRSSRLLAEFLCPSALGDLDGLYEALGEYLGPGTIVGSFSVGCCSADPAGANCICPGAGTG